MTRPSIPSWHIVLPEGMLEVHVNAPPECTSMAHLRGEIAPGAPAAGVISTQVRTRTSAAHKASQLAESFEEPCEPAKALVEGSRRAARVDGLINLEEALTEDGIERITVVVAELRRDFVVLTIRARPDDPVDQAIDMIVHSFRVEEPPSADR